MSILRYKTKNFELEKYEQIFRDFAYNRNEVNDFELRMTFKSLKSGLKRYYGGKENNLMASLIFNFFSHGKVNYEISLYEFVM